MAGFALCRNNGRNGMTQVRGDGFHDLRVDTRGDKFSRNADRIADREGGRYSVTDDDVPIHAEERRSASSRFGLVARLTCPTGLNPVE